MNNDLISRQSVLDAITASINQYGGRYTAEQLNMWGLFAQMVKEMQSAEEESFEWCTDCKEYDQEAHCCHRYSKMIRKTIEEMKLVHCIDCQHSEYDSVYGERWCHYNGKAEVVDDYHFCRDGEKGEGEPSQVARDIARIVENEQDMRVIAQPEIIRCKDCKNWDTTWTNDFSPNYHYCPMVDGVRKEDWYCADAERRTE